METASEGYTKEVSDLKWEFPPSPAKSSGFKIAGLSIFSAARDAALVRECLQNSLDADDGEKPVLVEIDMISLSPEEIGGTTLMEALRRCVDSKYNSEEGKQQFAAALEMLESGPIEALSITDLETTGTRHFEADEGSVSPWEALTNSEGHSVKPSGANLGSFGLGKHAPFASTPLRTVLYSTCYRNRGGGGVFLDASSGVQY